MLEQSDIREFCHLGFRRFLPDPALAHRVECYWSTGTLLVPSLESPETLYPDGGTSLLIDLDCPVQSARFVFNTQRSRWTFASTTATVSVRFLPGALYRLFGFSPHEWDDQAISAIDLLSTTDYALLLPILVKMHPENVVDSLELLEQFLLTQERAVASGTDRVRTVLATFSVTSNVEQMAEAASTSARTLERQFRKEVGMRPSELLGYRRIKQARAQLSQTRQSVTEVALSCGFYDQAHFSKSFARFVGETPSRYRQRKLSDIYKPK
ncbi:helix-turn-helix transcriptional regulator [Microbulbifer sp. CAU 1566]|uniref:helix-turn-helix transcriptional regulator n=1 Tax=Microbulbifer sp. CAU 1566 TaxID=2933269 RepID=UPI002002D36E|nr:helix-turn-helix transcriptional regulator [Microbulbifer sp. CAU 1566]MCK7599128.1 helix-turn-helix transcriptional regulator [Microbulbifer sp. CAU 1566]